MTVDKHASRDHLPHKTTNHNQTGSSHQGYISIYNYAEYRVNGIKYQLKFSTIYKIEMFIKWMSEKLINCSFTLHDEFLMSLTREQFIDFRQEDMKLLSNSRSSHIEPHTPMTTFTGHTKSSATT